MLVALVAAPRSPTPSARHVGAHVHHEAIRQARGEARSSLSAALADTRCSVISANHGESSMYDLAAQL